MKKGCLLFALAGMLFFACSEGKEQKAEKTNYQSIDTIPMLVMQVQKCSKLYTSEFKVHKIVTHDDVIRLKGSLLQQNYNFKIPLGDRKIAIPMDATLKAYIDFSQFSEKNIERHGDKITILLPDPKVTMTSSKIDQKSIREYVALTRAHFSDAEMTNYERQGRAAIIQSIPELGIIDLAKTNATRVLVPMFVQLGYKEENITVAFRKEFNQNNIMRLIEF
ncbi:MAG: DUF4230 domain-containing protein [Prevotella sp.]|nr:DUF4230 domain-containing protein [Prevotella sp.]